MDLAIFRKRALRHLFLIFLLFATSLVLAFVCSEIAEWGVQSDTWQGQIVYWLFSALYIVCLLGLLMFGLELYGWFAGYSDAAHQSSSLTESELEVLWSGVVGPINWRVRGKR